MLLVHLIKAKHISSAQTPLREGVEEHFGWMEINDKYIPGLNPSLRAFLADGLA